MSRTMQLTVQVKAHYPQSFAQSYPNLARHFEAVAPGLLGADPSLYELCGRLDSLLGRVGETALGRLLETHAPELRRSQQRVEELAADWKLAEADQLLYRIEDIFLGLEAELTRE